MSKARGQSLTRSYQRHNIDEHGNRTNVSSTKVTKSGMNTPGVYRKNKYVKNYSNAEIAKMERAEKRKLKEKLKHL
ncbi:MAG: hypothetical protein ACOCV1_04055 [Bacillota bacterium]